MTMEQPQARPVRETPVRRMVSVLRFEDVTPHLRRVTLGGPEMAGFSVGGPAEHMKVYFPNPETGVPIAPDFGKPPVEGAPRPIGRTYTPRAFHPDAMELDIDFVVHGSGPGSDWARGVEPGGLVILSTPKSAYKIEPGVERYLIAGDEAAVPAIGTILEALPASARADVYIEVEDGADELKLQSPADVQLTWLHRKGAYAPSALLGSTIRDVSIPDESRVFVACEATAMRSIKTNLVLERQIERARVYTHGYWKQGAVNHPDGDRGEEI